MANNPFDPPIVQVKKTLDRSGIGTVNRGFGSIAINRAVPRSPEGSEEDWPENIADLNDVDLSTPQTDGQVLIWNDSTQMWEPGDQTGGGGGGGGSGYPGYYLNLTGLVASGTVPTVKTLVPGMEITDVQGDATVMIQAGITAHNRGNRFSIWVDGVQVWPGTVADSTEAETYGVITDNGQFTALLAAPVVLGSGTHTVQIRWTAQGSVSSVNFRHRWISIMSLQGGGGGGGSSDNRVDNPSDPYWSGSLGYDEEFTTDDPSGALPTGWSWFNQGTSTYEQILGVGKIVPQSGSGVDGGMRWIERDLPSESTWEATVKVSFSRLSSAGTRGPCLCLRDSVSGRFIEIGPNSANQQIESNRWSGPTGGWLSSLRAPVDSFITGSGYYLRIRRNSATSYDLEYSTDGITWAVAVAATDQSSWFTPDKIGILVGAGNNLPNECAVHWFRVR